MPKITILPHAARRMDRSVKQALAGKNIANV
jgi:hypothetical protein